MLVTPVSVQPTLFDFNMTLPVKSPLTGLARGTMQMGDVSSSAHLGH